MKNLLCLFLGLIGFAVLPIYAQNENKLLDKANEDTTRVFSKPEKPAYYPGGMKEWATYLKGNLKWDIVAKNGAPPGKYPVTVQFNIDKEGKVVDIIALEDPGYGTADDVTTAIAQSSNWIPATQNGYKVKSKFKQVITYVVNVEKISEGVPEPRITQQIVNKPAIFSGGIEEWTKYIKEHLNTSVPANNHAPAGKYGIMVTFSIDTTGQIKNVESARDLGYGMEKEAIRVVATAPAWQPAIVNSKPVESKRSQLISFMVTDSIADRNAVDTSKTKTFNINDVDAQYKGGIGEWMKYLKKHLSGKVLKNNGAPSGQYQVFVAFAIDTNGNVVDVKAENNPGYGSAEEAMRVIRESPKWIPATQAGIRVKSLKRQKITFPVLGDL